MSIPGFDEIEPHVIVTVTGCALIGCLLGALPGAALVYVPHVSEDTTRLSLFGGILLGGIIGTVSSSTALLIASFRGRKHRHSTAGTRYRADGSHVPESSFLE